MEVWFDEWRLGDDAEIEFSVGDRVTMDVMLFEHREQLAALVQAGADGRIQHELFDGDDADPFITVQGRISGVREFRAWHKPDIDQRIVESARLLPVPSTCGRYGRSRRGGDVEAYVLSIAADHPVPRAQIDELAASYVAVNARQQRWPALDASGDGGATRTVAPLDEDSESNYPTGTDGSATAAVISGVSVGASVD